MNRFVLEAGAIPIIAWLDGLSDGERRMDEFVDVAMASGAAALSVIPDRNYGSGRPDEKLKNLYDVVALAERRGFPVVAGAEMNAPGRKLVDSFSSAELRSLAPTFVRGAFIVYARPVLQRRCGLGYLSDWAKDRFSSLAARSEFFATAGRVLRPGAETKLGGLDASIAPKRLLERLE